MKQLERTSVETRLKIGISLQEGIKGAPWAWLDDQTKQMYGFEADIAKEILKELDHDIDLVPIESYRIITSLINRSCDIAISGLRPLNKMPGVIYSNPYFNLTQKIVTNKDFVVNDLSDLKSYKVGVMSKSIAEFIIDTENSNLSVPIVKKSYNDVLQLFSAIHFNEIAAIFIDSPVALWYSKSFMKNQLIVSPISYRSGTYAIAVREDNKQLCSLINNILKTINLKEILEKYALWDETQLDS